MPRQPLSALALHRNRRASLQSQLIAGLKQMIQRGSIQPGDPLPSSRDLALELKVSRNTALAAYEQLISEGYLDARPRSGVFVAGSLAGRLPRGGDHPPSAAVPLRPAVRLASPRPFRPCQPDVRLFPIALWNRCRGRALRAQGSALLDYQSQHPAGLPALRRSLAEYLASSRGVRCSWEQVAITSGSQQALYLLSRLLLSPGLTVFLEDPGYLGARLAFSVVGVTTVPVPVDGEGLVPPEPLAPGSLVYTTPSRQFPTGASLSLARRLSLLRAAEASASWIIEDDYDSEFRYASSPLPSLQGLGSSGRVIYVGSMSKVLFPALRIGYLVLPERLVEPFAALRAVVDDHGPLIEQATLAEFISSGSFYSHIRRCRREYAVRLEVFLQEAGRLEVPLRFPHADAGMNLLGLWHDPPRATAAVDRRLEAEGFDVPPLGRYALDGRGEGLVFGFTAFSPRTIRSSWQRLAGLLR